MGQGVTMDRIMGDGGHPPDDAFWKEYLIPFKFYRGCALLGKTGFDKLGAVRSFLADSGFPAWDGRGEMGNCFIVHDCQGKTQRAESILKAVSDHRDASYLIFDNCEHILMRDDIIRIFVNLLDGSEYVAPFLVKSFYVFIGGENTLPRRTDFSSGSAGADHIDSFCTYVQCYDFDAKNIFLG
jgi:hypothetical protein